MIYFVLWVAIPVNYLTRNKVCNDIRRGSISFVIFYISLNRFKQYIFFSQIITAMKASEGHKDNLKT